MIIKIDDISLNCIVGVYLNEKAKKREILVSLKIDFDFDGTDEIVSTIDYDNLVSLLQNIVDGKNFNLIETICQKCGHEILNFNNKINSCTVEIKKPYAVLDAKMVSVLSTFTQKS